jgi:hypothetical protein
MNSEIISFCYCVFAYEHGARSCIPEFVRDYDGIPAVHKGSEGLQLFHELHDRYNGIQRRSEPRGLADQAARDAE